VAGALFDRTGSYAVMLRLLIAALGGVSRSRAVIARF
jgi:hypothetical protein